METQKEIYKAIIAFQRNCEPIPLNSTVKVETKAGKQYSFKYADLGKIHEVVKPLLNDQKLGFIQVFDGHSLNTILFHESGEQITSSLDISGYLTTVNPQDAGGVITYFKRYTLAAILGLVTEEDDDANKAAGNTYQKQSKDLPWLNPETEEWGKAVEYLHNNGEMSKILLKYRISRANQEKLISEAI